MLSNIFRYKCAFLLKTTQFLNVFNIYDLFIPSIDFTQLSDTFTAKSKLLMNFI